MLFLYLLVESLVEEDDTRNVLTDGLVSCEQELCTTQENCLIKDCEYD